MHYKPGPKLKKFMDSVDLRYEFHPDSYEFPFLKWEDFCALGKDISKNGLKSPIELLKGVILDGRHRYLACLMFKVEPHFINLPESTRPLRHVKTQNLHRRHLTNGQKYNVALALLKEERIKAKKRQERTQFAGRDRNNQPIQKSSVVSNVVPTEENPKKGKALVIVAKDTEMDPKTLGKLEKIEKVAEANKEIKNDLVDVIYDKKSVEEVFRKISAPKKLIRRTNCDEFRAAPCPKCYEQLMACKLDLKAGKLILRKGCPDPCNKKNGDQEELQAKTRVKPSNLEVE